MTVQAQLAGRHGETLAQQICPDAGAAHARPEIWIVAAAIAQVFNAVQHALGAIGEMGVKPVLEQGLDLPGQAQDGVAGVMRAGCLGFLEDMFHGVVVDERNDRRHQHAHRHARFSQRAYRFQPAPGAAARGSSVRAMPASSVVMLM